MSAPMKFKYANTEVGQKTNFTMNEQQFGSAA